MIAFIKVSAVLLLVAILVLRRVDIGAVMLLAAGVMLALFATPPRALFDQMAGPGSTFLASTGRLMVLIIFINTFGRLLSLKPGGGDDRTGTKQLIDAAAVILRDPRLVLAATPSVIGLLPMPGGALLSAPMVEEVAADVEVSPERKTAINYWYRHVYEYIFPLYPGLLIMAGVLKVSIARTVWWNLPLMPLAIAGGSIMLIGLKVSPGHSSPPWSLRAIARAGRDVLANLWPVLSVVGLFLGLWAGGIRSNWVLTAGLPVVVVIFALVRGATLRDIPGLIAKGAERRFLVLIIAVMLFKATVEATGAVGDVSRFLRSTGIPPVAICVVVPYLAGFLTGITVAFVGIAVPLLGEFLGSGDTVNGGLAMVTFAAGFMGVMTSPAHLCLVLSRDYYNADLSKAYPYVFGASAIVVAGALGLYAFGLWGS